jgi:hypothetical protein
MAKTGQVKVYVKSGQLEWVGVATGPLDAVKKALCKGNGKTLDGYYFYIDERGFRTNDAEFKVPINKGLKAAGYVYDDPACADD